MNTVLLQIGGAVLCYFAGGALFNFLLHLVYVSSLDKLPERLKPGWMKSHLGNAIASIISLFIFFGLLILAHYQFGFNINTLFLFIGISTGLLMIAVRYDKRENKAK
jgi:hypothetical protein